MIKQMYDKTDINNIKQNRYKIDLNGVRIV